MPNSLKSRLKKLEHQGLLSEKDLNRIIVIPNNATNGDVIKALFPDCIILDKGESFCSFWYTKEDEGRYVNFTNQWWNAPYKENKE